MVNPFFDAFGGGNTPVGRFQQMLNKQGKQNACDTGEAGNDKVVLSLLLAINDRLSLLPVILGLLVGNILAKLIDVLFF